MADLDEHRVDRRPVPDPTSLTTQQLHSAVMALREIIEARLNGMDKAIDLLQKATDSIPSHVRNEIEQLKSLHSEKFLSIKTQFEGINTQFIERDKRAETTTSSAAVAVSAALQAAKEAVGKSETSTMKQLDQIGSSMTLMTKTVDDKFDDVKVRLNALESRLVAASTQVAGTDKTWAVIGAIAALLIAFSGVLISFGNKGVSP